jgi:Flp pilus assembly protein TadB
MTEKRAVLLGQMMDAVSYMAMSMRVRPSLHRAILFAARNVGEPLASRLRQVIVDVELRKFDSVEEAFLDLARTHDPDNEEFQQALQALRTADLQSSPEGVESALERATSTIFDGTRQRVQEFADSLQRPVFVLFSLGIVLPLMVGSMLPLLSVGGFPMTSWVAALLMNVAFPLLFFVAARRILARRPLVRHRIRIRMDRGSNAPRVAVAIVVGGCLVALGLLCGGVSNAALEARAELDAALEEGTLLALDPVERAELEARAEAPATRPLAGLAAAIGYLPIIWAVAAAVAIYYLPALREPRRRRDEVRSIEGALPDALFQIGSRVAEGAALEVALRRTADGLSEEPISKLLRRTLAHLTLKRTSANEALFGREGALTWFPSEQVSASLRTVVEMVRKDVSGAGRAIVGVSNHLRDLRKVDRDISSRLRSVTEMMQSTATLFAPIILGVTSALYLVVARLAPSLPISDGTSAMPLPAGAFALIMGGFVLAIAATTMHFTAHLSHGDDAIEGRYQAARALPVAAAVYTVASVVGQTVVG